LLIVSTFSQVNYANDADTTKRIKTDSSLFADRGFKSLFPKGSLDASRPFMAQLNPQAVPFVEDYVKRYSNRLNKMRDWGRAYFNLYDEILTSYGVPKELKYLSVIESDMQAGAVSWVGAVGPWQLMPDEARHFGLKVNSKIDERTDYVKSTIAAAKYLKELYAQFGDWLLVVAAYNGGANRMKRILRETRSDDFWAIQHLLPAETRNHVKKFIGTHYIFEGSGGIATLTGDEIDNYKDVIQQAKLNNNEIVIPNTEVVPVTGRFHSSIIIKTLGLNVNDFNKLNPGFDKALSTGANYALRLPVDKVSLFTEKKKQILQESVELLLNSGN
jgi:membrane-bound lytic murein transglycosylase D